ncbi:hypothetical protein IWW36_000562 [Coemansia brasiliensis]|uniref:Queuosine 5'-phosphate N-glycosylase/hydrolase n=1 Tax=Coemansia brasiliensis TaxID=2650707 RepID=A0A9W8IAS3_9FUNG|nr:hypothetical protein IWW36_000562 [Coemansia brasiliensis]
MPVAASLPLSKTAPERVLDSAQFISQHSKDVFVPDAGISKAAQEIIRRMKQAGYSTKEWKRHTLTPSVADSAAIEWIFVVDALNFSFWSSQKDACSQYTVTLDSKPYRGYWSLCAAINRAQREGKDITRAAFYAYASREELEHVFRTDDPGRQEEMPLLDQRIEVLHQVGQVLLTKYGGKFINVVKQSQKSAARLVEMVVRDFPCFRDTHEFLGRKIELYKRAQILVADVWACFEGQGDGQFDDIDCITMFADYRVPQALCHFGALEYSPQLMEYLRQSEQAVRQGRGDGAQPPEPGLLPSGHPWEVEIRGNSIWAVERIRQEIAASGANVNAILIDFYMWDYAKAHPESMHSIPIHLTRCIYY